ncbi:MAG: tetratricopeptide repeat protein [Pseudoxanthomonas sp.]
MQDTIIDALRRDAVEDALTQAREWTHLQPENAHAHRWLAAALQQQGDHADAMGSIDRAIALAPQDDSLLLVRASLQIAARQVEEAGQTLRHASALNPNQLGAYLMQAQLAFGRGDTAEAERLSRLAARVSPDHPQLAVMEGLLALQRGQVDTAFARVSDGLKHAPDDVQLRYVLGLVYLRKQHWAFAEQLFRGVVASIPSASSLHVLISDLVNRQGRPDEAAAELVPLLADTATVTPAVQRAAGLLHATAGQFEQALPLLRSALAAMPRDRPTLQALVAGWRTLGLGDEARASLDSVLSMTADAPDLWQARLRFAESADAARTVLQRWIQAMPQAILPWEILLSQQQQAGDQAGADATAARLLERVPAHSAARLQFLQTLRAEDPQAAIAQLESWLLLTGEPEERRFLHGMLGFSHDQQGRWEQALETWTLMQKERMPRLAQLPPLSAVRGEWPDMAPRSEAQSNLAFLWGPPGSGVERLAAVLEPLAGPFRSDRFSAAPPLDGFQSYGLIEDLISGRTPGDQVASRWRAALPARGLTGAEVLDWLPWWDNALLIALRPHLRDATLIIALRDPRDMLLDWLAFGSAAPFAFPSAETAAEWLANTLEQIAALVEHQWFANQVLHTDGIGDDPLAAAALIGDALGIPLPAPDSVGPGRFPPGYWRNYAKALEAPFALLTPVAQRLGYPQD